MKKLIRIIDGERYMSISTKEVSFYKNKGIIVYNIEGVEGDFIRVKDKITRKKARTIIRQIDNLEKELWENYSYKEIHDAVIEEEKKKRYWGGSTGLVDVIFTGTLEMFENEDENC